MITKNYIHQYSVCLFCGFYIVFAGTAYRHALHISTELTHIDNTLKTVDLIIFSYDRPMQLYALLESIETNMQGIESSTVIYRSSSNRFAQAYNHVAQHFPHVIFIKQGTQPTHDFKPLVVQAFKAGKSPYICFAVDDIIVKNQTNLIHATQALETTGAYGFFLRLGAQLTTCYSENTKQSVPTLTYLPHEMCLWTFNTGTYDWAFAHTVDMTVYRKASIIQDFVTMKYANPNKLEGTWSHYAKQHMHNKGLCYKQSVIINIPTNLVQDVCNNRHMHSWTTEQLLEKFNDGQKIDISTLQHINNESCHIAYNVTFVSQ